MPSAPGRLPNGHGLLTAVGTLTIAIALAAPMFLPRDGERGMGHWLSMGRILELDHGHDRHTATTTTNPSYDRSAEDPSAWVPGKARSAQPSRRFPLSPARVLPPRLPGHDRHSHGTGHHGHGLVSPWQHLQCKVLHRRC
jgi:hypothetical protein